MNLKKTLLKIIRSKRMKKIVINHLKWLVDIIKMKQKIQKKIYKFSDLTLPLR